MKNAKLPKSAWDSVQAKTEQKWLNNLWGPEQTPKYVPAIGIRKFQKFQTQMDIALSGKGKKHQKPSNSKL